MVRKILFVLLTGKHGFPDKQFGSPSLYKSILGNYCMIPSAFYTGRVYAKPLVGIRSALVGFAGIIFYS